MNTVQISRLAELGKVTSVYRDSFALFSTAGTYATFASFEHHVTKTDEGKFTVGLQLSDKLFDVAFVHVSNLFMVAFEIFDKRDSIDIPAASWESVVERYQEIRDETQGVSRVQSSSIEDGVPST